MRIVRSFSMLAATLGFGVITLGASTAQAAPCCSAPMCQTFPPHPWCALCDEECVDEEVDITLPDDAAYDDVEAVCQSTSSAPPSATESAAPLSDGVADAS